MTASVPPLPSSNGEETLSLEAAWAEVEAAWTDLEVHRRFRARCLALHRLPFAGERYRYVRDSDPSRRADAERHIAELLTLATTALTFSRTSPPGDRARRRMFFLALGMSVAMVGYALFGFLSAR